MIYNYSAIQRTPLYVIILANIGWYIGLMVLFLIPIDIYTVRFQIYL